MSRLDQSIFTGFAAALVALSLASCDPKQPVSSSDKRAKSAASSSAAQLHLPAAPNAKAAMEREPLVLARVEADPRLLDRQLEEYEVVLSSKTTSHSAEEQALRVRTLMVLIYARHGRPFVSPGWRPYAERLRWHLADPTYTEARLSAIDRKNLELLARLERRFDPAASTRVTDPLANVSKSAFPDCPPSAKLEEQTSTDGILTLTCWLGDPPAKRLRHGPSWSFYPTGRLASQSTFLNGRENGRSITWFWNGSRQHEEEHKLGMRHGTFRTFHANGVLAFEGRYERDQPVGTVRRYFSSGNLSLEGAYRAGREHGRWTTFYDNGRPAIISQFDNGSKHTDFQGFLPFIGYRMIRAGKAKSRLEFVRFVRLLDGSAAVHVREWPGAGDCRANAENAAILRRTNDNARWSSVLVRTTIPCYGVEPEQEGVF